MTTKILLGLLILATLAATGCAGPQTHYKPVEAAHNPDATRLWLIQDYGGEQRVILCDTALLQTARTLCIRWPAQ